MMFLNRLIMTWERWQPADKYLLFCLEQASAGIHSTTCWQPGREGLLTKNSIDGISRGPAVAKLQIDPFWKLPSRSYSFSCPFCGRLLYSTKCWKMLLALLGVNWRRNQPTLEALYAVLCIVVFTESGDTGRQTTHKPCLSFARDGTDC